MANKHIYRVCGKTAEKKMENDKIFSFDRIHLTNLLLWNKRKASSTWYKTREEKEGGEAKEKTKAQNITQIARSNAHNNLYMQRALKVFCVRIELFRRDLVYTLKSAMLCQANTNMQVQTIDASLAHSPAHSLAKIGINA